MSFSSIEETEWSQDNIQHLIQLQELDRCILALREQMKLYSPVLKDWDTRLAHKKKILDAALNSHHTSGHDRRSLEQAVRDKEDTIRKFLQHQVEVRTNKEYQALTHEIDSVRQAIDTLEDRILEIYSVEEHAETLVKREQEDYRQLEAQAEHERHRIEAELHSTRAQLNTIKESRDDLARAIPEPLLTYYEAIFEKHPGSVIVDAKSGSCGGCFMQILPQILVEVRQTRLRGQANNLASRSGFRTCHRCLRLLIWDLQPAP